jgi:NAD(P)-dependent dehydrogenase (short-subunit alcohol dehydrogenase family)
MTSRDEAQAVDYDLEDRVALVTGASSGIGWETARVLGKEGARVVLVARSEDRLRALADLIHSDAGAAGRADVVVGDLSVRGEAQRIAREAEELFGPIDVLVNNAGSAVGGPVWAVADHDAARQYFEVDFWSPLALMGELVPGMRQRGHGAVVNVTSIRAVLAWPSFGHSSAACAALSQVTETLRLELHRFGVRVVEVIPGPIETPAQGPTRLIPGIVEAVHARLGTAEPGELALLIARAIRNGEPRVFCPEATTRAAFEDPVSLRQTIEADVRRLLPSGGGLPDEMLDSFVVASDDPMILDARRQWELENEPSDG